MPRLGGRVTAFETRKLYAAPAFEFMPHFPATAGSSPRLYLSLSASFGPAQQGLNGTTSMPVVGGRHSILWGLVEKTPFVEPNVKLHWKRAELNLYPSKEFAFHHLP